MSEQLKRVVINDRYTYLTDLELAVGDEVVLPPGKSGAEWQGTVTALGSPYSGPCKRVLRKVRGANESAR